MTTAATASAIEVRLARFRIADHDVEDLVQPPVGVEVNRRVQEGREVSHLRLGEIELRHPALGPADAEKRAQLFSTVIFLHDDGPREIGAARSTASVGAVAEAAVFDEERFPAIDRGLI